MDHWLAGLFEGEGSIGLNNGYARLQVVVADEDVVRRFHTLVGVGRVNGPYLPSGKNLVKHGSLKPYWRWEAVGEPAFAAMETFGPYLMDRRQRRWAEVAAASKRSNGRRPKG